MHILWFRRDLRLNDNESVAKAALNNAEVLPCFIIDPWFYTWSDVGKARVRFLLQSLEDLDCNLRQRGSKLYLFEGNAFTVLQDLTQQLLQLGKRPKLFFNHDVQVQYGIDRDPALRAALRYRAIIDYYQQHNLKYHLGLNNFLQTNSERRDDWQDEFYTYLRQPLHPAPEHINTPELELNLPQLTFAQLKQKYSQFWEVGNGYFTGGETQAKATLDSFLAERFHGYHWKISRPWLAQQGATSHLSPHLTFGTISVRSVYQRTKARAAELADQPKAQFSLKAFRDSEALPEERGIAYAGTIVSPKGSTTTQNWHTLTATLSLTRYIQQMN